MHNKKIPSDFTKQISVNQKAFERTKRWLILYIVKSHKILSLYCSYIHTETGFFKFCHQICLIVSISFFVSALLFLVLLYFLFLTSMYFDVYCWSYFLFFCLFFFNAIVMQGCNYWLPDNVCLLQWRSQLMFYFLLDWFGHFQKDSC